MKRWNIDTTQGFVKHLVVSIFVCVIILGLPIIGFWQWGDNLDLLRTNEASALPAFAARSLDNKTNPSLFDEPLISITFDDGWETTYSVAAPLLLKNGIQSTQYLTTGLIDDPAYLSLDQVKSLQDKGQQIACHTVSHPDLTKVTQQKLDLELGGCPQYFYSHKITNINDFAAPYGRTDNTVLKGIQKYYRSGRNTDGDLKNGITDADINLKYNFNQYNIIGVTVHYDTTVEELKRAIDYAIANKGWLVLTYHQAEEEGTKYSLSPDSLEKQLNFISSTPVRIVTVGQVMDGLADRYNQ